MMSSFSLTPGDDLTINVEEGAHFPDRLTVETSDGSKVEWVPFTDNDSEDTVLAKEIFRRLFANALSARVADVRVNEQHLESLRVISEDDEVDW